MDKVAIAQRIAELQEAMAAKERRTPPSTREAASWVLVYLDVDDESGSTVRMGVPTWLPRNEFDEWASLRFSGGSEG